MQIVIDISEEDLKIMKHNIAVNNPLCPLSQEEMVSKVANGTPLPKGHGRLIDADVLWDAYHTNDYDFYEALTDAETIIEADEESENKE